jgi:hypothetical protein
MVTSTFLIANIHVRFCLGDRTEDCTMIVFKQIFSISLVCLLTAFSYDAVGQSADPVLIDRFLVEAPQAWDKLRKLDEKRASHRGYVWISESQSFEFDKSGNSVLQAHRVTTDKRIQGGYRLREVNDVFKGTSEVHGINPQYAFQIERRRGSHHWLLNNTHNLKIDGFPDKDIKFRILRGDYDVDDGLALNPMDGNPSLRWTELPGMIVNRIEKIEYLDRECIEVEIEYDRAVGSNKSLRMRCVVVFDPNNYWLMMRATQTRAVPVFNGSPDKVEVERIYKPGLNNVPFAAKHTFKNFIRDQPVSYSENSSTYQFQIPSQNEFTLSAFDLPEPDWYRPPPPYWLYVSIGAIVLVILGAISFRVGQNMVRKR